MLASVWPNLRYSVRGLSRRPGLTTAVVLTLALGIGATTAIFTVVYDVLIKPLPYPDADELVSLRLTATGLPDDPPGVVDTMYFTLRDESRSLEQVGLWSEGAVTLTGAGDPERIAGIAVTDGTLQALDAQPALGRAFLESEYSTEREGPAPVILSHAYWQRRFAGDESVLGQDLSVDAVPSRVVGVMPASFRFLDLSRQPDVIRPIRIDIDPAETFILFLNGLARLRDGATLEEANADVARVLSIWLEAWSAPPFLRNSVGEWQLTPALRPLQDDVVRGVGGMLWLLLGAVGAVLLIACANIANLLLVRADERSHEFAIRKSIGAGRRHIAGNLFLDSLLLGTFGGIAGVVLALGGLNLLARIAPTNLPRVEEIAVGAPEVAFAAAMVLVSSLLFGLLPAVRHASASEAPLGARARGPSGGVERNRTRNALVVVQVSLALMLLVGAGLMLRTFQALTDVEPGFADPESIQVASISIPFAMVPDGESLEAAQRDILDRIAALPGVTAAGYSRGVPLDRVLPRSSIYLEGQDYAEGEVSPFRKVAYASPGFLEALGSRVIAGRQVTWADIEQGGNVLVLSDNLARELWGDAQRAIGQRVRWSTEEGAAPYEIVGVIEDTREDGLNQAPPPIIYRPFLGELRAITFAIRSDRAGTESFVNELRQAVWANYPALPVFGIRTMQRVYSDWLAPTSFVLTLLSIAGAMALVLSVVGIYGVVSYIVSQRSREIGIRLALGAQSRAVQRMFLRRTLQVATIGFAVGFVASAAFSRWMGSLLYDVRPLDATTYLVVFGILLAAVTIAAYLPARRAGRLDPAVTLRAE